MENFGKITIKKLGWLLSFTVFIGFYFPTLVQQGMFLDGITYSAISNNMASGLGSFFDPHYTQTLYPHFHEHPPLVFIIQSFFFKIFGNGFLTERIYCLFILLLTAFGISKIWRLIQPKAELKIFDWLPVLLWLSLPLVMWSYKNNLLENTMGVFTLFSVFFILKSFIEKRAIFLIFASGLIVCAFLSKGLVGLFPLAVPVVYAFVYKPDRNTFLYTGYLGILTAFFAFTLSIVFPALKENILLYFDQQLLPALAGEREITTGNRFSILLNLILELSLPITLLIYFCAKQWMKVKSLNFLKDKKSRLLFLLALSASIPLIISLKQRKFYLIPSIPFYILSISCLILPFIKMMIDKWSKSTLRWIKRISLISASFLILVSVFLFGKYSRDEEKLGDIYVISNAIREGTLISTTKALWEDWSLHAYLSRVGNLSLDADDKHEYYLIEKDAVINMEINSAYQSVDLKLEKYELLRKKP